MAINIIRNIMPSSLDGKSFKSTPQTNIWIIIHNTAGGTAKSNMNYFHNGSDGNNTCTHYVVDDKEIYQLLEDNYWAKHAGGSGQKWTDNSIDASSAGNDNSIGIEIADGSSVNHEQAIENAIELTRYLMKTYNIDVHHVIRHGDTQDKECPATIMKLGKWPYFKEQVEKRNTDNKTYDIDTSYFSTSNMNGAAPSSPSTPSQNVSSSAVAGNTITHSAIVTDTSITTQGTDAKTYSDYSTDYGYLTYYYGINYPLDIIPNVDHRYNIANMDKVTGAVLIFMPPYNVCNLDQKEDWLKRWEWDKKYHYIIDPTYDINANPTDDIPTIEDSSKENNTEEDSSEENDIEENVEEVTPLTNLDGDDGVGSDDSEEDDDNEEDDDSEEDNEENNSNVTLFTEDDFKNAIFIGDGEFLRLQNKVDAMKDARVFATNYQTIGKGRGEHSEDVQAVLEGTKVVIFNYGTQDSEFTATEGFITNYENFINDIKNVAPECTIFINKIFPGNLEKANENDEELIANIPAHNEALATVASKTGAILLDCTTIEGLDDYYLSALSFESEFYQVWYDKMKEIILSTVKLPSDTTTITTVEIPKEDNGIKIQGGFTQETNRLLQCYSMCDNDTSTYINRLLFNNKPSAHCLMIACFIPGYDDLLELGVTYENIEANIVNAVSKILWANGLETKDLWREFDLNRAPSPALYLERNKWKGLLAEIDKQLEWRNANFGKVTATYEKYEAKIPDQNINMNTGGGTGNSEIISGDSPIIDGISDTAQAVWTFLTGKGYTPEVAAGILGNMYQESGVDPTRIQGNGKGPAAGICQWENYNTKSARWKAMADHAASKGKEWTDLQSQLEWLDMELQGKDPTTLSLLKKKVGGYEEFKKITDIDKACLVFEESFERAGKPNMSNRYKAAHDYYKKFNKTTTGSASALNMSRTNIIPNDGAGTNTDTSTNNNTSGGGFSWPTPTITKVSSKFGPRKAPCAGASTNHKGIDISAPMNTDVHATLAGKVTLSTYHNKAGNYIVIDHGNGCGSRYLHLNKALVKVGDTVQQNQVIAKSGNTGIGTGAHLHFEIHESFPAGGTKGTAVDPLKYVSPGQTYGSGPTDSGDGSSFSGNTTGSSVTTTGIDSSSIIKSLFGEIENPGPAIALPYTGNSMGGLEHDDWGGKMTYKVGEASGSSDKPEISNITSSNDYKEFCDTFFKGDSYSSDGTSIEVYNFQDYWSLVDTYAGDQEPYDKGIVEFTEAQVTENDRWSALTTTFTTANETTVKFNVIESGPGSRDHCVKSADELNIIMKAKDLKCEPIYPDLIIPPQYVTSDADIKDENMVPLSMLHTFLEENGDLSQIQLEFDYELLKDKVKKTEERLGAINFLDPYPTDDKIKELEEHQPKVFIDEIESQIYSCNHPGCPIAQPMAKNFAMLQDGLISQASRTEKRLVRLENILSTIMRNQARLGARININCVYYGGQSTINGKYACIRCMHDDRINDGAIVTIDQCLNCTRYEPILGQIYQILDESGMNGSIVLDDMQMSYSDLETYQRLNKQTERSPIYDYVNVIHENVGTKPEQTRIDMWKNANKNKYLESHKDDPLFIETDDRAIQEAQEAKYLFRMDWRETFLNHQEPDIKPYPLEGIIKRYKKEDGDGSYEELIASLDPELDKDEIEDAQKALLLMNGEWINTMESSDTVKTNKYSSENFYFENFAEIKKFSGGIGSPGYTSGGGSGSTLAGTADCRKKIVEMAEQIYQDGQAGKAWYSQPYRTTDYTKPNKMPDGRVGYDCSSTVSCCYRHAGLMSLTDKTCSGGGLVAEVVKNPGEMWLLNEEGLNYAKPGDVIMTATRSISQSDMGKQIPTSHTMIYIGDGQIIHAAGKNKGILKEDIRNTYRFTNGKHFFMRPLDLQQADKAAAALTPSDSGTGVVEESGTTDGKNYIAKIPGAVVTSYSETGTGSSGMGCEYNKTVASHNLPYGTKIYIPQLNGQCGDGVFTVTDTGGCFFDFDVCTNKSLGKTTMDAYVLEWGSDTTKIANSYTWAINLYKEKGTWDRYKSAWDKYKTMGGKLIGFTKYSQEDANITSHPNYNDK